MTTVFPIPAFWMINIEEDALTTTLFSKKGLNGAYLNLNSHLPDDYKKGLIETLFWADNICSDYMKLHLDFFCVKSVPKVENAFLLFLIDKCVQKFLNMQFAKRNEPQNCSEKSSCLFLYKISVKCHHKLRNSFVKLKVVFKSSNRLKNPFRFKD